MSERKITLPWGTFINMTTVAVGSLIGWYLQQAFPENIRLIVFQGIGLGTIVIGIIMSLKIPEGYLLNFIFSLILGGILGELIGVQALLQSFGDGVKSLTAISDSHFTEGLITAFLLFCVGSMTFVGAIEEGLKSKRELLLVKSTLDGVSSIALASTLGIGVLFSIVPMLIFQGGITVLAQRLQSFFTPIMINQLSSVGGVLIIGIAINILELGTINIENLLPALLVTLLLTALQQRHQASN